MAGSRRIAAAALQSSAVPSATAEAGLDLRDVEREAAITRLFHRHYAQLVRMAVLIGADEEAEDIVEEAFCALHRRWRNLRDSDAALGYLRSVVCNQTRMRHRHQQVVRRHNEEAPPDAASAESIAVLREDQREVIEGLRRLPGRQREALVLRYWLGLRESEVAHAMCISPGAVKAHTARGMAGLKRLLTART
jgi:RNA polymerase sigma-70 factor (sigma-E family)